MARNISKIVHLIESSDDEDAFTPLNKSPLLNRQTDTTISSSMNPWSTHNYDTSSPLNNTPQNGAMHSSMASSVSQKLIKSTKSENSSNSSVLYHSKTVQLVNNKEYQYKNQEYHGNPNISSETTTVMEYPFNQKNQKMIDLESEDPVENIVSENYTPPTVSKELSLQKRENLYFDTFTQKQKSEPDIENADAIINLNNIQTTNNIGRSSSSDLDDNITSKEVVENYSDKTTSEIKDKQYSSQRQLFPIDDRYSLDDILNATNFSVPPVKSHSLKVTMHPFSSFEERPVENYNSVPLLGFPFHTLIRLKSDNEPIIKMRIPTSRSYIVPQHSIHVDQSDIDSNLDINTSSSSNIEATIKKFMYNQCTPCPIFQSLLDPESQDEIPENLLSPSNLELKLELVNPLSNQRGTIPYLIHEIVSPYEIVLLVTFAISNPNLWSKCEFNEGYYNNLGTRLAKFDTEVMKDHHENHIENQTQIQSKSFPQSDIHSQSNEAFDTGIDTQCMDNQRNSSTEGGVNIATADDMYRCNGYLCISYKDIYRRIYATYQSEKTIECLMREKNLQFLLKIRYETPSLELLAPNHRIRMINWEKRWGYYQFNSQILNLNQLFNKPSVNLSSRDDDFPNLDTRRSNILQTPTLHKEKVSDNIDGGTTGSVHYEEDEEMESENINPDDTNSEDSSNWEDPDFTFHKFQTLLKRKRNSTSLKDHPHKKPKSSIETQESLHKKRCPNPSSIMSQLWSDVSLHSSNRYGKGVDELVFPDDNDEEIGWIDPNFIPFYKLLRKEAIISISQRQKTEVPFIPWSTKVPSISSTKD